MISFSAHVRRESGDKRESESQRNENEVQIEETFAQEEVYFCAGKTE